MNCFMIKLAVFDLAGTTVHDEGGIVTGKLHQALQEKGFPTSWEAINATMGIPKRVAITQVAPTATPDQVDEIHERFRQLMIGFYADDPSVKEISGVASLFGALKSAGIKVGLDTGFDRETTDQVLARMPWDGLYDASVASDEVEHGRPAPDLIYRLMTQLGIEDVKQVAKIGDTPSDLGEGTSAGSAMVIGVCYGSHTRSQLELHPHTHLVDTLEQLREVLLAGVAN